MLAHYGLLSLDGLGTFSRAELSAAGALIAYLELTQKGKRVALGRLHASAPRISWALMPRHGATWN